METKKVKLKSISFNEGVSWQNRNYTMVFVEVNGTKASMYCDNQWNKRQIDIAKTWKPEEEIYLTFEQKGEFLNFRIPTKADLLELRIEKLERVVAKLAKESK